MATVRTGMRVSLTNHNLRVKMPKGISDAEAIEMEPMVKSLIAIHIEALNVGLLTISPLLKAELRDY